MWKPVKKVVIHMFLKSESSKIHPLCLATGHIRACDKCPSPRKYGKIRMKSTFIKGILGHPFHKWKTSYFLHKLSQNCI